MKFDKSKVCVAGLHEVKEGTKGWFSNELHYLKEYVENEDKSMFYVCTGEGESTYEIYDDDVGFKYRLFYPALEKQYRPFETIEEAQVMKGKWIRSKIHAELFMVTNIRVVFLSGRLLINESASETLFNNYVIDETGEPVGVEE